MFERIVVPADLTERNREAVAMASRMAAPNGSICLLHVIETIPGVSVDEEREFYEKLEQKASAFLAELGTVLTEKRVEWTAEVVYGSRARTILDEARKLGADLIVIRSHRIDRESSAQGFGTLSYQVGILAECPVLLVK
ncbi:MAG: universal stress protein [Acidobacteriota bacterium]|nr:MAG: universal stress protein [Acidobacteriota bacterium]